jgi:hypothetical protein
MKRLAGIYTLIAIVTVFIFPQVSLADSSSNVDISNNGTNSHTQVNVQTNTGGNTICQNGNCTTTSGGNGTATVCINGNCQTSDSGNINVQSQGGNDQVNVTSNSSGATVTVTPEPTQVSPSPLPSVSTEPSLTPNPTVTVMRNDLNRHVKKEIDQIKEHVKDQNVAISSFIQTEVHDLQSFLTGFFK